MAFDGIVISNIVRDLKEKLVGGRILKISQPEKDELILTVKNYNQYKLFISADASLPLIYLSSEKKEAPLNAPNFCMLLRKHLGTARITDIYQPEFERIINIELEHLDEMGDVCHKRLIVEIMGKHSNIIFCDTEGKIIDSIKHVSGAVSSVREVLPGRDYFITKTLDKLNPLEASEEEFIEKLKSFNGELGKALYMGITGFSPLSANEVVFRAGFDTDMNCAELSEDYGLHLYRVFSSFMQELKEGNYRPCIVYKNDEPVEFAATELTLFEKTPDHSVKFFDSISEVLETYYSERNLVTRIRQKSADLRKVVANCYERISKKRDLQLQQLKDTEKRDKYKLYGELLTTYGYNIPPESKSARVNNYYTGEDIEIPLDPQFTAIENAKRYYNKYSKLKRTYEAVTVQLEQSNEELLHLDSIKVALDIALLEDDLTAVRNELIDFGYIRGHFGNREEKSRKKNSGSRIKSSPMHFVTEDGFHIYVGKNNYQNDELTFKFASGGDWWFHAKKMAGSHVVVKTEGKELPDRVYEQAAALAAYYSKAAKNEKVDVDYLERKNVKKPNGARPGFVVYYTNYSMTVYPSVEGLTQL